MAGAESKLLNYFLAHVGEEIPRETLMNIAGISDWPRTVRTIRQKNGLEIKPTKNGYVLESAVPVKTAQIRKTISSKLKYEVLEKYNSTCQRCGANVNNTPNVKLVVDHKIPVELGGATTIDNLWILCSDCNGGKQAFFSDDNADAMKNIMLLGSAAKRIKALFELYPNVVIEPTKIGIVANVRDWERTLRLVRQDYEMPIKWVKPCEENPAGGYIFIDAE